MPDLTNTGVLAALARKNAAGSPITDEANLEARFISDQLVYSDAGTTLLNASGDDGSSVQEWHSTHNSYTLSQTTAADKPTFQWNEQNGNPGIQFAASDFMDGSTAITAYPFTIYIVAEVDDVTNTHALFGIADASASGDYFYISARGADANDPLRFDSRSGGGSTRSATTTTGFSAATAFVGTFRGGSGTDREALIDDGSSGTSTDSSTPANLDQMAIASVPRSSPFGELLGKIYEIRIYLADHDSSTQDDVLAEFTTKWGT